MTGRGAGLCAGNTAPGYAGNAGFGRGCGYGRGAAGRGMGRGLGRGYGYRAATPPTREEQIEALKAQAAGVELQLKALNEQIGKLESE